jgi:hypothetical protein
MHNAAKQNFTIENSDMFRFFKNNTQGENIDQICTKNELK